MLHRSTLALLALAAATLLTLAACDDDGGPQRTGDTERDTADTSEAPDTQDATDSAPDLGDDTADADDSDLVEPAPENPDCDPLVPQFCAMPWPSSRYLVADAGRVTGYRLELGPKSLPRNSRGRYVDPAPYARMDGFGVSTPLLALFPALDGSNLPDENHVAHSLADDAPIVLLAVDDQGAAQRIPYFADLDLKERDDALRTLIIRPAVLLEPDTHYVVGLRDLHALDGQPITPSPAFLALRDATTDGTPLAERQAHFETVFAALESAGVARSDLILAWDFHTASHEAMHGPLVHMRDEALATVGDDGPPLTVTAVNELDDPHAAYEIELEMEVPHYLEPADVDNVSSWLLTRRADGLPEARSTRRVPVLVRIPHSALDGTPHAVMMHAHGLNGSRQQIRASWFNELANQEHFILVGVDMIGMSSDDISAIVQMITDLGLFARLTERLHQGLLEHLLAMRAMRGRFATLPEIEALGVVLDGTLWFNGISQGGIYGGTVMALATDFTRGQLGVPGINYSLLLPRSHDFDPFFALMSRSYWFSADHQILLAAIQTLWDQVDPASWYRHISHEPLPDTPAHQVLLGPAIGDYQVAPLSLEILARSDLGVPLMANYGRAVDLVSEQAYPHQGSGIVMWDFGNPWPQPGPVPPPEDELGDPHEKPRRLAEHNQQMMHFFRTGEIIDVCDDGPCRFAP